MFNCRMEILNHRLVDCGAVHLQCAKNTRKLVRPDLIVLHYTAGTDAMSSAIYLTRPDVQASAHLVIGRDGRLIQLVPFNTEAWHAGRSCYEGRVELNHYSIGIELDNLGQLHVEDNQFMAESGHIVQPEEVYTDVSDTRPTYWHTYTRRQVSVLIKVCRLLKANYPIRHILGHSEITPRKLDPGPALLHFQF